MEDYVVIKSALVTLLVWLGHKWKLYQVRRRNAKMAILCHQDIENKMWAMFADPSTTCEDWQEFLPIAGMATQWCILTGTYDKLNLEKEAAIAMSKTPLRGA